MIFCGAIKFKNQAKFHPLKYLIGILNTLEKNDCHLYENSKVIEVKEKTGGYEVTTDEYKVNSKYVVLATHYPIINFPGFHFLKMYQDRSYIIAIETKEKLFEGVYITSESPEFSYRTAKFGDKELLLVAGAGHKTGDKAVNIESAYIDLENHIKTIYPDAKVLYRWCTEDCVSLDKVPYIGEFSNFMPYVYMATGFKKWGMTSSHIAAQIISDEIQGISNDYEKIFSSVRLSPIANKEEFGANLKQTVKSLLLSRLTIPDEKFEDIENNGGGIVLYKGKKVGIYKRSKSSGAQSKLVTEEGQGAVSRNKDEEYEIFAVSPYCGHLRM